VPEGVYDHFRHGIGKRGKNLRDDWFARIDEYRKQYADLAEELFRMQHRQLPEGWDRDLPEFPADPKGLATRESSAKVLNAAAKNIPWLIGGSADLAPSTKTRITQEGAGDFSAETYAGRNLHFGIDCGISTLVTQSTEKIRSDRAFDPQPLQFDDLGHSLLTDTRLQELEDILKGICARRDFDW